MNLIFIHGRSQGGKNPDELRGIWQASLDKGLEAAGLRMPPGVAVRFPFYGDKLDDLVGQVNSPLVADVATRGGPMDGIEPQFRYDLLDEIRKGMGISEDQVLAELPSGPQERGAQNWRWVHAILRVLDKTPLGVEMIDRFTRDVYVYLCYPAVAKQLHDMVTPHIQAGPCVVVGHSLGSIVGYNSLHLCPGSKVSRYVTVGSPLGLQSIKGKLATPLSMPACTRSWFNARDPNDVVALHPLDAKRFGITPAISNKDDVKNHTDNQHSIEGYLDDPVVASQIYDALTS